ncbi:hypothetical protein HH212_00025 [Massilia forsythiae]|uniref:Uncharacterized protein n=1 Tax=Massilia forsythiae TaxID=2728020 RepID=A0A7Z2VTG5_9BURK|nr:hypothetical protein [Massilia forsythiae]QJD98624.1 hypothetical protein HH212_00025 [Massilia forsythiae]
MKLFAATAQVMFVVVAENEPAALLAADQYAIDAARDSGIEADWAIEITSLDQLPPGWRATDLPYGGVGCDSIATIFASAPAAVVRDLATTDMFEVIK